MTWVKINLDVFLKTYFPPLPHLLSPSLIPWRVKAINARPMKVHGKENILWISDEILNKCQLGGNWHFDIVTSAVNNLRGPLSLWRNLFKAWEQKNMWRIWNIGYKMPLYLKNTSRFFGWKRGFVPSLNNGWAHPSITPSNSSTSATPTPDDSPFLSFADLFWTEHFFTDIMPWIATSLQNMSFLDKKNKTPKL